MAQPHHLSVCPPCWSQATKLSFTQSPYLGDEVFVLLHEVVQVILVLVDALQQVGSLKLQPAQLLIHLAGGRTTAVVRYEGD